MDNLDNIIPFPIGEGTRGVLTQVSDISRLAFGAIIDGDSSNLSRLGGLWGKYKLQYFPDYQYLYQTLQIVDILINHIFQKQQLTKQEQEFISAIISINSGRDFLNATWNIFRYQQMGSTHISFSSLIDEDGFFEHTKGKEKGEKINYALEVYLNAMNLASKQIQQGLQIGRCFITDQGYTFEVHIINKGETRDLNGAEDKIPDRVKRHISTSIDLRLESYPLLPNHAFQT